jgi:uncharacterized membrane protein
VIYLALDPDNDTARQWLRDELSKPRYADPAAKSPEWRSPQTPGFLDRLGKWLSGLFNSGLSLTIGFLLLALLIAVAGYVVVRVRRETRRTGDAIDGSPGAVLGGIAGTAEQFRSAAAEALAAGDYDNAVLAAMRAIAQSASDRTLLLGARSATAHDIARRLRHVFPDHYGVLYSAAEVFDAVAYGGRHAGAGSAAALVHLDADLRDTRPTGYVDDEIAEMSLPLLPPVRR